MPDTPGADGEVTGPRSSELIALLRKYPVRFDRDVRKALHRLLDALLDAQEKILPPDAAVAADLGEGLGDEVATRVAAIVALEAAAAAEALEVIAENPARLAYAGVAESLAGMCGLRTATPRASDILAGAATALLLPFARLFDAHADDRARDRLGDDLAVMDDGGLMLTGSPSALRLLALELINELGWIVLSPRLAMSLSHALEALEVGEVTPIFTPAPKQGHGNALTLARLKWAALYIVRGLYAAGWRKNRAEEMVAAKYGVEVATLRTWQRRDLPAFFRRAKLPEFGAMPSKELTAALGDDDDVEITEILADLDRYAAEYKAADGQ